MCRGQKGSTLVVVVLIVLVLMAGSLLYLKRAGSYLSLSGIHYDVVDANLQMEAAYELSRSKLLRALDGMLLSGKLPIVHTGLTDETAFSIVQTYNGNELTFLRDMVKSVAVSGGSLNSAHEFANFDTAFPSSWTDPVSGDSSYVEVKYTFNAAPLLQLTSPVNEYIFEYEYQVDLRGYGSSHFSQVTGQDGGILQIVLRGAPFSQWSLFRSQTTSPTGSNLYFAGGDTSAQIQEVFRGPVHTNSNPNFYGHPTFNDLFTSASPYSSWNKQTAAGYSGTPIFAGGYASGPAYSTTMPTQIYNTTRLAAGDPDPNASTNNASVTNANLVSWMAHYAGGGSGSGSGGSLPGGTTSIATGIYIPINNPTDKVPTGGIYVEGDARVVLNVVQGSADFPSNQWNVIQPPHQTCKFQKIKITSMTGGIPPRDIYVGDDPCDVSYVFDGTAGSSTHMLLNGRINGNAHVNGAIDELGGESRTRPGVVQDFGLTISAQKDVRIKNDIQYEDAEYVTMTSDGTLGTTVVADPYGTVNSSGYTPTSQDIAAQIPSDSQTVLGIISVQNNVKIHANAPANINLHGAVYAGNNAPASGGYGCGSGGNAGCGFGVENYTSVSGRGSLKLLGSISEYRSQGIGVLSTGTGYSRRYSYDPRFRQDLTPPGFPISNQLQAYPALLPIKTRRLSKNP